MSFFPAFMKGQSKWKEGWGCRGGGRGAGRKVGKIGRRWGEEEKGNGGGKEADHVYRHR